jgi:hypothetical protein
MIIQSKIRNDDLAHVELLIGVDLIAILPFHEVHQRLVLMRNLQILSLADVSNDKIDRNYMSEN